MIATQKQIQEVWIANGGSRSLAPTMSAIAMAESSGNSENLNDNPATGDYSIGWWQINYYGNLRPSRTRSFGTPEALRKDVNLQAKAAISIAKGGAGLPAWSTYRSGEYLKYMGKQTGSVAPIQSGAGGDFIGGLPIIGPAVSAARGVGDVISFFFNENGLIRIAEVVLGFGALTIGVAALIVDSATNTPTKRKVLTAAGAGGIASARRNPAKAAKTVAVARRTKIEEKKAASTGSDTSGKPTDTGKDFPRATVIEGSGMYKHKQTESARRRNAMAAERKRAMSGDI